MLQPIPIPFGFYQSDSKKLSIQRCINWLPVVSEKDSLNNRSLIQPPGLKEFSDTLVTGNRGGLDMAEVPYFVNGKSLVSVSSLGVTTNHGNIVGSGRVSLATNGQYLVIVVPGVTAYAYDNRSLTLTEIKSSGFRVSNIVVFKDGYFVFAASDGSFYFNSALNDPFTYSGLDVGTAEINEDKIISLHVNHNELFVQGTKTIEIFQNVGGSGFPFQRIPGANIQKGNHARFSNVEFDNTFCFLGGGLNELPAIWKVTGSSSAVKISTDTIDKEIQKFNAEEISNAFALTLSYKGQFLALFTIDSERIPSRTFVYNATASLLSSSNIWFEFQDGVIDGRFCVQSIVPAYGKLLVGDNTKGIIGEIDESTLTYYGDHIFRQATTQPFDQNGNEIFSGELEATFDSGVGLTSGEGSDPVVRMRFSDDGGNTMKGPFRRKLGKIGKYKQRTIWARQGSFPQSRSIEFTVTDPIRANLVKLAASPEVGL